VGWHYRVNHLSTCNTGRVLQLIEQLQAAQQQNSTGKEHAPANIACNSPSEDGIPSRGDFGEPWTYGFDSDPNIEQTRIVDIENTLIAKIGKADREARNWAGRIVNCINFCAEVPGETLRNAAVQAAFRQFVKAGRA
jgi:hypothetical protein